MRWLLLRGLAREHRHWGDFPALLQLRLGAAELIVPDAPGNGQRYRERSPATIADLTENLRDSLHGRSADEEALVLVGLSLGGMVALDWAEKHPNQVAGVVLINSSARPLAGMHERLRPSAWPSLLRVLLSGPVARERPILALTSASVRRQAAVLPAWQAFAADAPVSRANVLRQLLAAARFRCALPAVPLLVLASAKDRLVDPACSQRLALSAGASFHLHPEAGHDLPLDDPDWVAARIAEWARSLRSSPVSA